MQTIAVGFLHNRRFSKFRHCGEGFQLLACEHRAALKSGQIVHSETDHHPQTIIIGSCLSASWDLNVSLVRSML